MTQLDFAQMVLGWNGMSSGQYAVYQFARGEVDDSRLRYYFDDNQIEEIKLVCSRIYPLIQRYYNEIEND